jgi:DNA replication protein DnaC
MRKSQPIPVAQVEVKEPNPEEQEYFQAIKSGQKINPVVLETSRELWDSFNSDRHPKLQQAVKVIKKWYNERIDKGGALVLAGGYGCGKSHLAKAIHQMMGPLSTLWYEPDLFGTIQDTYNNNGESEYQLIKQIRRHKLLVIDDLGSYEVKPESERWVRGIYQKLIDSRHEEGKGLLITTNLDDTKGELEERLGERCYDRLVGALEVGEFYVSLFGVPSYRRRNFMNSKRG